MVFILLMLTIMTPLANRTGGGSFLNAYGMIERWQCWVLRNIVPWVVGRLPALLLNRAKHAPARAPAGPNRHAWVLYACRWGTPQQLTVGDLTGTQVGPFSIDRLRKITVEVSSAVSIAAATPRQLGGQYLASSNVDASGGHPL